MEIEEFFKNYVAEISKLFDDDSPIMSADRKNPLCLKRGDITFCFNCALYELAKKNNFKLLVEESKGRCGYSDISLYDQTENVKHIEIEHENEATPEKIRKAIRNLLKKPSADLKIFITYSGNKDTKYSQKKVRIQFTNILKKMSPDEKNIWLIIANKRKEFYEENFKLINSDGIVVLRGRK